MKAVPMAAVFDCDGLLLDTESCWTRAEETLFARYGRVFTTDHKRALLGRGLDAAQNILERLLGQPGRGAALGEELYALAEAEIRSGARPMPGAPALVAALRGVMPLAVASNTRGGVVDGALRSSGLRDAFDAVVGGNDVGRPKPAPDVYLRACELLMVAPDRAVALEDSPVGAESARLAGMRVVGVPSVTGVDVPADLVVPHLGDRRLWRLLGLADV